MIQKQEKKESLTMASSIYIAGESS